jgi:hypothetical protein
LDGAAVSRVVALSHTYGTRTLRGEQGGRRRRDDSIGAAVVAGKSMSVTVTGSFVPSFSRSVIRAEAVA